MLINETIERVDSHLNDEYKTLNVERTLNSRGDRTKRSVTPVAREARDKNGDWWFYTCTVYYII